MSLLRDAGSGTSRRRQDVPELLGDVHDSDVDRDPGHLLPVAPPRIERLMNRVALLRRGVALEGVTVGYNGLEGVIAIAAGLVAGSVALTGFGIDSLIEVASGAVLWWRLRAELGSRELGPAVEARAARWAGGPLLALGVYIGAAGRGAGPSRRARQTAGPRDRQSTRLNSIHVPT